MTIDRVALIRQHLNDALHPSALIIHDDSADHIGHAGHGGAGHFSIEITCVSFAGLSMIECHRAVYQALAPLMPTHIHALSIRAHVG